MAYGSIYKISNTITRKVYIGQTIKKNPRARWACHKCDLRSGRCKNIKLLRSWQKYGPDCWVFEVIAEANNQVELDALEAEWISREESNTEKGYNIKAGGSGRGITSETTKKLIGASATKRYKSEVERYKCGNKKRGVPKSKEHREKISKTLTGNVIPRDVVEKYARSNREMWAGRSEDEKAAALKFSHDRLREKYAEDAKEKYPPLISPSGEIIEIDTCLAEFCRKHNLDRAKMHMMFKEPWRRQKGWSILGSTPRKYRYITNGTEERKIQLHESVPEGWVLGMKKRRRTRGQQ